MATKNYNCTQPELYAVCRNGWANYNRSLASFTIFRPIYTNPYGLSRIAEITAAELLPDEQTRDAAAESARVTLSLAGEVCLSNWQTLKRYIIAAFQPSYHKSMLEAAGSMLYEQARGENWDVLNELNVSGSRFIAANNTVLSNNQNMPAFFPGNFNNAKTGYEAKYLAFTQAEETAKSQTDAKVVANNNLYSKLISMFLDGQEIFKSNTTLVQEFIFADVLNLITSPGAAGLKGVIRNSAGNAPLEGVTVTIVELAKTAVSDVDGSYDFSRIASGDFTVKFEKAGFTTVTLNAFRIPVGTTVTKDVVMAVV